MSVGYLCRCLHLFLSGIVNTKSYIVEDSVVEKDGLLIDVAYDAALRTYGEIAHIISINGDGTRRDIVIAWDEVDKSALA